MLFCTYRVSQKKTNRKILTQILAQYGQILPWTWLGKAWSGLVLVRNDQKINLQTQGVPANGDWASALWLQKHSEIAFFLGHPVVGHLQQSATHQRHSCAATASSHRSHLVNQTSGWALDCSWACGWGCGSVTMWLWMCKNVVVNE